MSANTYEISGQRRFETTQHVCPFRALQRARPINFHCLVTNNCNKLKCTQRCGSGSRPQSCTYASARCERFWPWLELIQINIKCICICVRAYAYALRMHAHAHRYDGRGTGDRDHDIMHMMIDHDRYHDHAYDHDIYVLFANSNEYSNYR